MLEPHRYYRKFKVLVDWFDDRTHSVISTKKTMDIGSIQDFEELADDRFKDKIKRVYVRYESMLPPQILRISYEELDAIFTDYLAQNGRLDERSVKKKLTYNGPIKIVLTKFSFGVVSLIYPAGHDVRLHSFEENQDALIDNIIAPY